MRRILWLLLPTAALAIGWIAAPQSRASFAAVPLEILVDEAEVIVLGKVTKVEETKITRKFGNAERKYDAAVIEVAAVLKGPEKLKEVRVAQPAKGGLEVSTDIRFKEGQEGVWILNRQAEPNFYWATHPSQFQPAGEKDALVKLRQGRAQVPASKPVNGLVARAEVFKSGDAAVWFSLKNVSDKPVMICNYLGNRPLSVEWTGPDGKKRESKHYAFLAAVLLQPLSKDDFLTIPPGGVLFLGPGGRPAPIRFEDAEAGEHKVTVGFTNKEDGKQFKLPGVWTGKVEAPAVTFQVK